jgi:hypothetical protein
MAKPRAKPLLLIVGSVVTTAFLFGFYIGRARSVDYSDSRTTDSYLALYSYWTKMDSDHGELSLRIDDRIYRYKTGGQAVSVEYPPLEYLTNNPMPTRDLREDLEKTLPLLVPTAETGLIGSILMSENRSLQSPMGKGLLIFGTLTGGILGYYVGHDTKPNYQTAAFRTMLQSVPLWESVEKELRNRYLTEVEDKPDMFGHLNRRDHAEVLEQAMKDRRLKPRLVAPSVFDATTSFDKKITTDKPSVPSHPNH